MKQANQEYESPKLVYTSKYRPSRDKHVIINQDDIDHAKAIFFANGGKIIKIKSNPIEQVSNPYGTGYSDNYVSDMSIL